MGALHGMGCNTSKDAVVSAAEGGQMQPLQDKEEDIDIDLSDPRTEEAATRIQAVFRGHKVRAAQSGSSSCPAMKSGDQAAAESASSQLEQDFNPNDQELCHAATKIQASFRGHMARKQGGKGEPEDELSKQLQKLDAKEDEELDIDLSDPDLHKAATKIQASFRGHKVRKEVDGQ
ncbi:obscurin [Bacillus rossius redtenbacheri]|uniref:obscurin n=1 Tax=Bacillus rossius redtenbacheri TaxID=93214 RepID=UPI002FDCFCF2